MIRFLLQRPIAVLLAFTACFIVGLVTYFTIPVSLLPDIAIPEITVQISGQNTSARGIGKHRREAGPFAIDASGRITGYP